MISTSDALNYLTLIISALGILIGFLLLFLQYIPGRKRRIKDIIFAKKIDLATKDLTQIKMEEEFVNTLQNTIEKKKININLLGIKLSLITINMLIFVYTIILFISSLYYLLKLSLYNEQSIDGIVIYIITILTIFDYILLIPMVYLSCVKDYEIKVKVGKKEK